MASWHHLDPFALPAALRHRHSPSVSDAKPMTPVEMRERARLIRANLERRIQELRNEAEKEAQELEAAALVVERYSSGLSLGPDNATIGTMPEGQTYRLVKKGLHRGPALESDGPAAVVAKKHGLSLRGLSEKIKVSYERLKKQDARNSLTDDVKKRIAKFEAAAKSAA